MPLPNEHSFRLRNPSDFDKDSFRRTKGGTIYGSKKVPASISIVWAKLKGKAKPSDNPMPQALRFPKDKYTPAQAKKWMTDNNIKYKKFEKAKNEMTIAEFKSILEREVTFSPPDSKNQKGLHAVL